MTAPTAPPRPWGTLAQKIAEALAEVRATLAQAQRPVVLCSFGKDSMVLLHLVRLVRRDVPLLFWVQEADRWPEKYAFAAHMMRRWRLRVFSMAPSWTTHVDVGDHVEIVQRFGSAETGDLLLPFGCRPRHAGESPFLCTLDYCQRPSNHVQTAYPWDVTLAGVRASDGAKVPWSARTPLAPPPQRLGTTQVLQPLWTWTDDDIWHYIRLCDVPYDRARYDAGRDATSPDTFPTCAACLDPRARGRPVPCPRTGALVPNVAMPDAWHAQLRRRLASVLGVSARRTLTEDRFLDWVEIWPLFTFHKHLVGDAVWVIVEDLPDLTQAPDGLRRLRQETARMEHALHRAGVGGWLAWVHESNQRFHRWVVAVGAQAYAQESGRVWFRKSVQPLQPLPTVREAVRSHQEVVGHA